MKIAIIGSGAMGCLYGAYLSLNNDIIMIDSNKAVVDEIKKNRIILEETNGDKKHYTTHIEAYYSGQYQEKVDLVIMFVKSIYLDDALEQNKNLFLEDTLVLSLQNGAGNDKKISKYVKEKNIIIGTTKHNAVSFGMGCSKHTGPGVTIIGSKSHSVDILLTIKEILKNSNFETVISDDIQRIIWEKLFVNLSINTFTAITQTKIGYMIENKDAWRFAKRLIYEAVEVAEEDGTYFDRREVLENVKKVCQGISNGYSSMYQDVKRKMRTEIDAINGVIIEQAKLYGVPVPYNSLIVDLIHAIEGTYDYEK